MLLNIYFVSTLFITSYYCYDLYSKENTFNLFLLHLAKSSFYQCLLINLIIMIFLFNYLYFIWKNSNNRIKRNKI